MPTPSYSPTDVIAAIFVVISFVLDVLTGYGLLPAVDPQTRTALIGAFTVLTLAGTAAYIKNRSTKTQAQAAVAVAQAAASVTAPLVATAPASEGIKPAESSFVLTPPENPPPPVPLPKTTVEHVR